MCPEVAQRQRERGGRRRFACAGDRLLEESSTVFAELFAEVPRPGEGLGAGLARDRRGALERGEQPVPPRADASSRVPEEVERERKPERALGIAAIEQPPECRLEVVVVGLEPVEPAALIAPREFRFGGEGEGEEVLGVAAADLLAVGRLVEPLERELVDRLKH